MRTKFNVGCGADSQVLHKAAMSILRSGFKVFCQPVIAYFAVTFSIESSACTGSIVISASRSMSLLCARSVFSAVPTSSLSCTGDALAFFLTSHASKTLP